MFQEEASFPTKFNALKRRSFVESARRASHSAAQFLTCLFLLFFILFIIIIIIVRFFADTMQPLQSAGKTIILFAMHSYERAQRERKKKERNESGYY